MSLHCWVVCSVGWMWRWKEWLSAHAVLEGMVLCEWECLCVLVQHVHVTHSCRVPVTMSEDELLSTGLYKAKQVILLPQWQSKISFKIFWDCYKQIIIIMLINMDTIISVCLEISWFLKIINFCWFLKIINFL